jgi:hypothetical protein
LLFPVIAQTGTILIFVATCVIVGAAEGRWRRLGEHWWTAFGVGRPG